ncbi:endonuclease/exonuclease/phosphatase family protein [Amycolatopsis sp. QT-25]|uniref:endonuclease/exonuclease/phosphatase family protein n=1 Tax=Amycolatopsis sp. QT-25 TaxID=3034022 RepID=UPI0023EDAC6F|nr:endonuclease/exonuclease/phosphatase family protein [Amycolatopsis sp. QT-25]WET79087.1 endonuclease/exonuclease/phosphatase family protein [Amycolatopsis sp. QT-25]
METAVTVPVIGILDVMVIEERVVRPAGLGAGRKLAGGLLIAAIVPFAVLTALRLVGYDGNTYTIAALALTPYAGLATLVLGILALVARRWWTAAVALVLTCTIASMVLPRAFANEQKALGGKHVRVLASNLLGGQEDPARIVGYVKEHQVDVLSLTELTPESVTGLARAGLFDLLPYRVLHPAEWAYGSGLVSKYPLTPLKLSGDSDDKQPSASVDLGDGVRIEVVAVHPAAPMWDRHAWVDEAKDLPYADAEHDIRILAGDFNAGLDHALFRELLTRGYVDAADQLGRGLRGTWTNGMVPPVPIDHVLADKRTAIADFKVLETPGSDHDAVYAEVVLPGK